MMKIIGILQVVLLFIHVSYLSSFLSSHFTKYRQSALSMEVSFGRLSTSLNPMHKPSSKQLTAKHVSNIMTLSRFIIEHTRSDADHADLEGLVASIQLACKTIASLISRSGVSDLTGLQSTPLVPQNNGTPSKTNLLYDMANNVLKNSLRFSGKLGILAAEDDETPMLIEEAWNSNYVALFDPLDGALNIDIGIVTGTIFGIYKENDECLLDYGEEIGDDSKYCLLQTLQPSKNLIAAGYCMYSSTTILMISMGNGVHGFTLDPSVGEFVLTHPNVQIPKRGQIYSFNEAYSHQWSNGLRHYIDDVKQGLGESKKQYSARYIGSLVGDIHRTLLYGGVFGYPGNNKYKDGKLRYLHELCPMAFLIEQAGGKASTGSGRLLDLTAKSLNQHSPAYLGSYEDIKEVEKYLASDKKK